MIKDTDTNSNISDNLSEIKGKQSEILNNGMMITYKKLEDDGVTEIRYIYHISDIHIRNTQRHDEYNKVFERTYHVLRSHIGQNNQLSLIIITGDIMHSKTELSPESIHIAYHFFKKLNEIATVILIPGNHDCNLSNKDRMDALTPIVEDIGKLNNLFYLKRSGIYQYHNILFGVTSILDGIFVSAVNIGLEILKNIKQKIIYKIALYHGPVHGAKTDVGYRMNTDQLLVDDFVGYDYVMLGDIHKFQYMDKEKKIAYAGSLIQQSHGEKLNNHGILKWNLMNGQSELINIKNDYGFCTITIKDGKMMETQIPRIPRIRFILEDTTQVQLKEIIKKLEKKYNICEIVTETNIIQNLQYNLTTKKDSLTTYNTQEEMIKNYLKKKYPAEDNINTIIELHNNIYQKIIRKYGRINDNIINRHRWKILELHFSNMLSYGKDNVIDFKKYDSNRIIGIVAPNHYGKSAILDIILFCLFDKFSRGDRRDILNKNEKEFYCSILLEIGNQQYFIERVGKRKGTGIKIDVNFYLINVSGDGKKIRTKLNGLDRNETNRKIVELLGNYHDYLVTCFCLQNDKTANFIDMTQTQKKEYLNEILNLNIFENCCNIASDKLKKLMAQIKILEQKINTKCLDSLKEKIKKNSIELKNLESQKEKYSYLLLEINNNIEMYSKYQSIVFNNLSKYNLNDEIIILETIKKIESKIDKHNTNELESELESLRNKYKKLEENILSYVTEKHEIKKLESKKETLLGKIIRLPKNLNFSDEEKYTEEIISATKRIDTIRELLGKYDQSNIIEKTSQINILKKRLYTLRQKIKTINYNVVDVEKKIAEIKDQKCLKENTLFFLLNNISNIPLYGKKMECIEEMINTKKEFVSYLTRIDKEIEKYQTGISINNDSLIENIKTVISKILEKYRIWIEYANKELSYPNYNPDAILDDIKNLNKRMIEENYKLFDIYENNTIIKKIKYIESKLDILKEFSGTKQEIDNLLKENEILNEKVKLYNEKKSELLNYKKQSIINEKKQRKLNKIQNKIDSLNEKYSKIVNELKTVKEKINHTENKINKYRIYQNDLKMLNEYYIFYLSKCFGKKYLDKWKEIKKNTESEFNDIIKNIEKRKVERAIYTKEFEQYLEYRKHYDELFSKINTYQLYVKVTNFNGLPYEILKTYLPLIESNINQILYSMTNFGVEILFYDEKQIISDKNKSNSCNIDINIRYHDKKSYNVQLASGFERFVIGLVIRITLSKISMTVKPDLFIIDEGWSCLDIENLNNVSIIMDYIRSQYEHTIIISHLEELKNQSDYIINIEREKGYSYIKENQRYMK